MLFKIFEPKILKLIFYIKYDIIFIYRNKERNNFMKRKIGTNRKSDDLFMPDFFDKELALKRWPERKLNPRETDYTGIKINGWTFMYPVEKQKNKLN